MFLKAESREVHARAEHLRLGEDTDTSNTINLHLHIRVTVRVAQVGQMRTPGSILGVALNNDGVLIKGICKGKSGF
jgi:hypothetical protein